MRASDTSMKLLFDDDSILCRPDGVARELSSDLYSDLPECFSASAMYLEQNVLSGGFLEPHGK